MISALQSHHWVPVRLIQAVEDMIPCDRRWKCRLEADDPCRSHTDRSPSRKHSCPDCPAIDPNPFQSIPDAPSVCPLDFSQGLVKRLTLASASEESSSSSLSNSLPLSSDSRPPEAWGVPRGVLEVHVPSRLSVRRMRDAMGVIEDWADGASEASARNRRLGVLYRDSDRDAWERGTSWLPACLHGKGGFKMLY